MKMKTNKPLIKTLYVSAVALLLNLVGQTTIMAEQTSFTLKNIHQNIKDDYKGVKHISRQTLIDDLTSINKSEVIIFDVRELDEFAVSHLKGAKQLSPSTWKSTFLKNYGNQVKGKKIIFYCSVGVRSSKMAQYLGQSLKEQGAKDVYNLTEGIFGWANEGAPLYQTKNKSVNQTTKVHPYNSHWGKLIKEESLKSYTP